MPLKGVWAELKQRRRLEVGTEAEALEGAAYGACSPWFAQPAFLQYPGPSARGGTAHSELGSPTSIIKQENALWTSGGGIISIEISKMTLAYVDVKLASTRDSRNSGLTTSSGGTGLRGVSMQI